MDEPFIQAGFHIDTGSLIGYKSQPIKIENFSKLILPFGLLEFLNFVPSTKHLDHTLPWPGK